MLTTAGCFFLQEFYDDEMPKVDLTEDELKILFALVDSREREMDVTYSFDSLPEEKTLLEQLTDKLRAFSAPLEA